MKFIWFIIFIFTPNLLFADNYYVGTHRFKTTVNDSDVYVRMFYPTNTKAKSTKFGPWTRTVAKNVKISSGTFPLIAISHGLGGNSWSHFPLAEKLVHAGFIVVAVAHPDDLLRVGNKKHMILRPIELSKSIDAVLTNQRFKNSIDISRIGAFGYSLGGYTTLTIAGGISDMSLAKQHCTNAERDPEFCFDEKGGIPLPKWLQLKRLTYEIPNFESPKNLKDSRIKTIVLAAPLGVVFSDLSNVTQPLFLIRAENDQSLRPPFHAENIHRLLPKPHRYQIETGLHHYAFLAPFPESLVKIVGEPATDPKGFGREKFQDRIYAEITDFFLETLPQ